ncbi:MAG: molybdopterin-dependent oxidoreductase [Alphaproteobacteria bacterium]
MLSRRSLLKIGAAAPVLAISGGALNQVGAVPLSGGKDFSPTTGLERQAIATACWQCVTRCPSISYVEDGRLVKIEGQPNSIRTNGVMCSKGQGGVGQSSDPDRILYPMRRVGPRGSGRWKRVSWDEALGELTERLQNLRDEGTDLGHAL